MIAMEGRYLEEDKRWRKQKRYVFCPSTGSWYGVEDGQTLLGNLSLGILDHNFNKFNAKMELIKYNR